MQPESDAKAATFPQKQPPTLFQQWWYDKKFFPLVLATGQCGLTFEERMTWSYILYRTVKGGTTLREIARATGLDRSRILPKAKVSLIDLRLVSLDGDKLIALEPGPEHQVWFSWRQNSHPWHRRLRVFPVCHSPKGWTAKQTAIYFCLLTSNVQSGRKINRHQKKTGIGAMLQVSHDTVQRAFRKFEQMKLVEYDYLLCPPDEVLDLFPDRPDQAQRQWLASIACGWGFGTLEHGATMARWLDQASDRMLAAEYTKEEVLRYWDHCRTEAKKSARSGTTLWKLLSNWDDLFIRAEADTARNRNDGKYKGRSGLGLLMIESSRAIATIRNDSMFVENVG